MNVPPSLLRQRRSGATLLITVLIVGSVALVIAMSIVLRGIGELDMALRTTEEKRTLALAEGCLQKTLLSLWGDQSFAMEQESFPLGAGTCSARVAKTETNEDLREVVVQATIGHFTRSIRAIIDSGGARLTMLDWELLAHETGSGAVAISR